MNLPDKDVGCHRTGFTKTCLSLVSKGKCKRWVTLEGENPQNGHPVSESRCVDDWTHTLLIDVSRKVMNGTAGLQAATEDFRNCVLEMNGELPRRLLPERAALPKQ